MLKQKSFALLIGSLDLRLKSSKLSNYLKLPQKLLKMLWD